MIAIRNTRQLLMEYFAALGAAPHHLFSVRDFNTHVMMNAYDSKDRGALDLALTELVTDGILGQHSKTEYLLTPEGLSRVRSLRKAPQASAPGVRNATGSVFGQARGASMARFDVTFFEWARGSGTDTKRKVNVEARDRGSAVEIATSGLSPEERGRFAVLRVTASKRDRA
ncbi:MAG: hypothetical protein ACXWBL_11000 [Usitatibacter sp.]